VDDPTPGEGQVPVDIEAVGVNYRDVYERQGGGYGTPPPAVIGVEGTGRIADSGERVGWVAVPGSYATRVAADRDRLVPIPDGVSSEDAAAAMLQGMTAHYLAFDSYPIEPGDWVVVHASAGGVGLLLTQLAKLRAAFMRDGGTVTAPRMGIWFPNGKWDVENVGVSPDVEVIITDELPAYRKAIGNAKHETVNHIKKEYVRFGTDIHTNTIESAFSLFKRGIIGNYHRVSIKHLQRYLDEFTYRFNHRTIEDLFSATVRQLGGFSPLPYRELVSE